MERLPLFIALGALVIWTAVGLFSDRRLRTAARGVGFGLSLVQLGSAIWAAVRIFGDTAGVRWSGVWFSLGESNVFDVKFNVDQVGVVFWLALSLVASMAGYFALLAQAKGTRSQNRGEAIAVPLLAIGTLCTISSGNFIAYCFGWALLASIAFMTISFSAPTQADRASSSFRYFILNIIPELLFVAGLLGCYAAFRNLSFEEINAKAASDVPSWAMICLVLGTMMRNLQLPLIQSARHLAVAGSAATPVYFLGHVLVSSALFTKIYPAIMAVDGIHYLAIIPAFTAIACAVLALPEEDPAMLVGWFVTYVCASVFLAGLSGGYQAAHALALTGTAGVFLLALVLTEFPEEDRSLRWFAGLAMLVMSGLPISGWGWARYLEYLGIMHDEDRVHWFQWVVLSLKILADLLMGTVLWGIVRERWLKRSASTALKAEVVVPLIILSLACVAAAVGGRPFGGVIGVENVEFLANVPWFEKLVQAPTGSGKMNATALELLGSDVDITARILVAAVFALPALLAGIWFFRDTKSLEEFRAFCRRLNRRLGQKPGTAQESKLWGWVIRPLGKWIGNTAALVDMSVIDHAIADAWLKPARAVRQVFWFIERNVIDKHLIDGLGQAIGTIGKALRLVQNGQVQFYFALGLILMSAVVIKFIVVGG